MTCLFKWVQFSDIHFQTKNASFNTKELRDKLPKFLESSDDAKKIDAMIISGDFRYAPEKEENPQKAVEYIKQLATALKIKDISKSVITVPGNHDLKRGKVRTAILNSLQNEYNPEIGTISNEYLDQLFSGFEFYNQLHEQLGDASNWTTNNPHSILQFNNCNILTLNTAITAGSDDDSKHLVVGSSYIQSILSGVTNNHPTIAVGHHALDELDPKEEKTISHYLVDHNVLFYMCGHTHDTSSKAFGEYGKEVNIGCMMQSDNSVISSFLIGELHNDGTIKTNIYKWDMERKDWYLDPPNSKEYSGLYPIETILHSDPSEKATIEKAKNPFSITGYTLLGSLGCDGIKYFWIKNGIPIESIAFNKRLRSSSMPSDNEISAYTISTSFGCQLATTNQQCKFCETGAKKFNGHLKAEDIALQCIFMAEYDSNCPSYPQVRTNAREFSFMGQGEPGYNYSAIRKAIIMNDYVMKKLDQKVSRYIISTCGISDFVPNLIEDIKNGVFENKVTLHFSLHQIGNERSELMPINSIFNYTEMLDYCNALYQVSREKIGVGILMFDKYQVNDNEKYYSLTPSKLESILNELDRDVFRIDLCAVNQTSTGRQKHQLSNESASNLLDVVIKKGFEGKIFTSFGDNQQSGCGMLSSSTNDMEAVGTKTIKHFNKAIDLLEEAKNYYNRTLARRQ